MRTRILTEEMFNEIKGCMDNGFYEQTVKENGEPKTPEEFTSFVMAYMHNDRMDRNGEARAAYRLEHEQPPLSLMMKDPVEYNRQEHDFHEKFPIKTFTDVVKEQTGITINSDLSCRMYFEKDNSEDSELENTFSKKKLSVEEQLKKSTEKHKMSVLKKTNTQAVSKAQAEL